MKIKMKLALTGVMLAALLLISGCGDAKLGYVDGDRLIREAPQLQTLIAEANEKTAAAEKEAQEKIAQKESEGASDEELQKEEIAAQRKLEGMHQSYSIQLKQKIDAVLAEVAKDKELDAIVNSSEDQKLLYLGGEDLTDEVIRKLQ